MWSRRCAAEREMMQGTAKRLLARVPEPVVPQFRGRRTGQVAGTRNGGVGAHRVQIARRITLKDHLAGADILDRKPKSVKFNRDRVVASKLTNGEKTSDDGRGKKNIVKFER